MIGSSAVTFFIIGLSIHNQINIMYLIAFSFFITGVIASSRIEMKAHTIKELTFGYLVGLLPQLSVWYFWL
jgi:hypothetical protein